MEPRLTKVQKHTIKKMLRENTKFRAERKSSHDTRKSNFDAPPGFQVEDPLRLLVEDGQERLQYFFGNLSQAVQDLGMGEDVHHELIKWVDSKTGDYHKIKEELFSKGYELEITEDNGRKFYKTVTLQEAFEERLALQGNVSGLTPQKALDDSPNVFWKWEYARRAKGEMDLPTPWATEGKRDRKDRSYNDPEDVPWGDMSDSDPFGQGVQTVDVKNPVTGRNETMWLQEKKIYGPVIGPGGEIAEGVIGTEKLAQPFWKLIIPNQIKWWEIYDSSKRPLEALRAENLKGIWDCYDQFRQQVDKADCEIRGLNLLPWGVTTVKVMVPIPQFVLEQNEYLSMIEEYKDAKYIAFEVMGPAVPALKEAFQQRCEKFRNTELDPKLRKQKYSLREKALARKKLAQELAAEAKKLYEEWEKLPAKDQKPKDKKVSRQERIHCRFCGRTVNYARVQALRELEAQAETIQGAQSIRDMMTRCVYQDVRRGPNGVEKKMRYCTGKDLDRSNNTK